MRAYSMDLRQRVLAACDGGMTTSEAAEEFSVSPAWVRRLKQRRQTDEVPAPRIPRRAPSQKAIEHFESQRNLRLMRADDFAIQAKSKCLGTLQARLASAIAPKQLPCYGEAQ